MERDFLTVKIVFLEYEK